MLYRGNQMLAVSSDEKLKEAAELLTIVQQFCADLSSKELESDLPWKGLSLTLAESRKRIEEVRQSLQTGQQARPPGAAARRAEKRPKQAATSLASRIQRVPPPAGKVREIPLGANNVPADGVR